MSKVKYTDPIKFLKGKISKEDETIYKEMYGDAFTSKINHPRDLNQIPYTAEELERQNRFKTAQTNAATELANAAKKAAAFARWKALRGTKNAFKTLRGMVIAEEYAKLTA